MSKEARMKRAEETVEEGGTATGEAQGVGRATEDSPAAVRAAVGPLAPGQRWSVARKREVVLRLLRGESVEALSRELGVEIYQLEEWRQRAFTGIDASLRERGTTAERLELDAALKRLGELTMDHELLLERCRRSGVSPLVSRRSGR